MTRIKRTPQQIAADMAEKAQKAAERAALATAATDPVLIPVTDALKREQNNVAKLKRSMADTNPNSFANRRKAFELRLAEIDAAEKLAQAQLWDSEGLVAAIKDDLNTFAEQLADGVDITDAVASVVPGYFTAAHHDLQDAFDAAHNARKTFKAGIGPDSDNQLEMTAGA